MKIFTYGSSGKNAETFFSTLKKAGVKRLIDVRLHNNNHLLGFTKQEHLCYFANEICGINYKHMPKLAPTETLLDKIKRRQISWLQYERRFLGLMTRRKIEKKIDRAILNGSCLLCSEHKPDCCHRRLVAEYLKNKWRNVEVVHL